MPLGKIIMGGGSGSRNEEVFGGVGGVVRGGGDFSRNITNNSTLIIFWIAKRTL